MTTMTARDTVSASTARSAASGTVPAAPVSSVTYGSGSHGPTYVSRARLHLAQPVDGEPGRDADEIAAWFAYVGPVGAGPAQPRVLDDVLGVGHPAEHAVGDAHQDGPVLFEDVVHGVGGHDSIPTRHRG